MSAPHPISGDVDDNAWKILRDQYVAEYERKALDALRMGSDTVAVAIARCYLKSADEFRSFTVETLCERIQRDRENERRLRTSLFTVVGSDE